MQVGILWPSIRSCLYSPPLQSLHRSGRDRGGQRPEALDGGCDLATDLPLYFAHAYSRGSEVQHEYHGPIREYLPKRTNLCGIDYPWAVADSLNSRPVLYLDPGKSSEVFLGPYVSGNPDYTGLNCFDRDYPVNNETGKL
jgi:hypothetical protein